MATTLTPRDAQNRRDACMIGLVPCTPDCKGDRTLPEGDTRRWNGMAWSLALKGAQRDRAERIATNTRRNGFSVEFLARDAGLVPHAEKIGCSFCKVRQTVQSNAAAVVGFEYRHQHPSIYHATAWNQAR